MTAAEARSLFARARVARLATSSAEGVPHLVPVCFAVDGDVVYSAADHKPKSGRPLRRLSNVAENPRVALLADHYDDADWRALWWVRADGRARLVDPASEEAATALALLQGRYFQYRAQPPAGPVLAVDVERWSGWASFGAR